MVVFIIATIICMIFVKKKIVHMVSAITELNKCALSLTSGNNMNKESNNINVSVPILANSDGTNSKREVM